MEVQNHTCNVEQIELDEPAFYKELKIIVERVLASNPELEGVDLSKSTLWRWSNGTNKKLPDANKVLALLFFDSGLKKIALVGDYYGGAIKKFLKIAFPAPVYTDKEFLDDDKFLKDKFDFYIYYICGTLRGVTEDELKRVFGRIMAKKSGLPKDFLTDNLIRSMGEGATKRVERFLELGIVEKDEEGFLRWTHQDLNINTERIQELSLELTKDFVEPDEFGSGMHAYYTTQQSIKPDVAKSLTKKTRAFLLECYKEMQEGADSSPSAIPFTISVLGAKLTTEPLENNFGEVLQ